MLQNVNEVVKAILPLIVHSVMSAVTQAVTIIADKFVEDMKALNDSTVICLKKQLKQQSYQTDGMEQYTLRDNIKIKGITTKRM